MKIFSRFLLILITFWLVSCSGSNVKSKKEQNLKQASELNVQLAVGFIQRDQLKYAREKLLKAIEQDPESVGALKMLAFLSAKLAEDEKAEEYYLEALDIDPKDPDLHNSYGTFLCKLDRVEEAQEAFKFAYSHPFYDTPYLALSNAGTCLLKTEKYAEAEKLLRKSLRVQPKLAGSLISMAEVGVRTKRYLMARAYIQRYHEVSRLSAESLWLQIQAEKALGAKKHYMKFAKKLLKEFPDSAEAGWLEDQAVNERIRTQ